MGWTILTHLLAFMAGGLLGMVCLSFFVVAKRSDEAVQ
jgi:hypothetical protein